MQSMMWLRLSTPLEEFYLDLRGCNMRPQEWEALQGLCTMRCLHIWLDGGAEAMRLSGMLYRADSRMQILHLHVVDDIPEGLRILNSNSCFRHIFWCENHCRPRNPGCGSTTPHHRPFLQTP